MATNPNSIVRLHSRRGGRGSVLEANMAFQIFNTGLLAGRGVTAPDVAALNIVVGGTTDSPDVVIAENPSGYKIALDIVGQTTIALAPPTSNSQIVAVVAYTDELALTSQDSSVTGNPSSCGLLVVPGTTAASPTLPTDTQIRDAITADGAVGNQAAYGIIASVTISSTTEVITDSLIMPQNAASEIVKTDNIDFLNLKLPFAEAELLNPYDGTNWPTNLYRIGNLVLVKCDFVAAPPGDVVRDGVNGSIIPNGFRPSVTGVVGAVAGPNFQDRNLQFEARFEKDNPRVQLMYACTQGGHRFGGSGWYLTDDPWPTE